MFRTFIRRTDFFICSTFVPSGWVWKQPILVRVHQKKEKYAKLGDEMLEIDVTLCRRNTRFKPWVVTFEWIYIHLQCSQLNHDSNMGWSSRSRRFAEVIFSRFGDACCIEKLQRFPPFRLSPIFSRHVALATKRDTPTASTVAPARKSDAQTSSQLH